MNRNSDKKGKWSCELISACCGFGICFIAFCLFVCMDILLFCKDSLDYYWYLYDFDTGSKYIRICGILLNLLLIGWGYFVVRFEERIKKFRGKAVFWVIPMLLEMLSMALSDIFLIGFIGFVCIFIMPIVGLRIRTYKISTYLISCIMGLALSIPCAIYIIIDIYGGRYASYDLLKVALVIQPFVVLFPIISLIKRAINVSDSSTETACNNSGTLQMETGDIRSVCPSCGKEQEAGNKFCVRCGQKMAEGRQEERYCPQCGARIGGDMLFCKECGVKL